MKPDGESSCIATGRARPRRTGRDASRDWALFAGALAFALAAAAAPPAGSASKADRPEAADAVVASPSEPWPEPDLDLSTEAIEPLRRAAQVGDVDAAVAVTARLVDRFERGGSDDDLFEATIWIDRYQGNEAFAASGVIAHVQQRDCRHRVLRLHPICGVAE